MLQESWSLATTVPTSGWSTNIPTGMAAGTYYVWYRLDPDAEHSAIAAACITVTIAARSSEDPTNNDPVNNEETTTEEPTPTPTPVPVDNSDDSPFSPVPEITATTESLYLIKGQTFSLNDTGWTSTNKKVVSVSKTGAVKAIKKTENKMNALQAQEEELRRRMEFRNRKQKELERLREQTKKQKENNRMAIMMKAEERRRQMEEDLRNLRETKKNKI